MKLRVLEQNERKHFLTLDCLPCEIAIGVRGTLYQGVGACVFVCVSFSFFLQLFCSL